MHLFDTFAGLPEGSDADHDVFRRSQYACSQSDVRKNLSQFDALHFHEGLFPASAQGNAEVENAMYALAHFDVDLYEGTKECLDFFYPRMTQGGILISHDYFLEGVQKAFDEFLSDKPEELIEMPTTQCMVIKR